MISATNEIPMKPLALLAALSLMALPVTATPDAGHAAISDVGRLNGEALACGQAVLSTRFGALGLELTGVGGLHCCDWPDFDKTLRALLADPLQPGSNHPGRCWAESLDWRSLSRAIPWADFTQTPPAQNCPDPEKCAARSA